ncbi:hypothetical protein LZ31DRAFT_105916 [Colletotrichum somersetense]|nr:hypothetical protein LZ31DRAFT_105916 [Colletotrichum somersetense]
MPFLKFVRLRLCDQSRSVCFVELICSAVIVKLTDMHKTRPGCRTASKQEASRFSRQEEGRIRCRLDHDFCINIRIPMGQVCGAEGSAGSVSTRVAFEDAGSDVQLRWPRQDHHVHYPKCREASPERASTEPRMPRRCVQCRRRQSWHLCAAKREDITSCQRRVEERTRKKARQRRERSRRRLVPRS